MALITVRFTLPATSILRRGRLAQLVERLPYKQEVGGSSPSPPIWRNSGDHWRTQPLLAIL
jgi:hypothetical protein